MDVVLLTFIPSVGIPEAVRRDWRREPLVPDTTWSPRDFGFLIGIETLLRERLLARPRMLQVGGEGSRLALRTPLASG